MPKIGETVRLLREERGYTQAQLAERAGIPRPDIVNIENNRLGVGADVRGQRLAAALSVELAELGLGDPDPRSFRGRLEELEEQVRELTLMASEATAAVQERLQRLERRLDAVERPKRRRSSP